MLNRFRNTPAPVQTMMVIFALVVVTVILAAVWFFALRVDYQPIFTKLRASDASAIVADLEKRKVPYKLSDGGTTIAVPAETADATRLSLMSSDLALKDTVGFELFNKSDMGITDFAQKINFQRALQGELERTIAGLDGVETARVHLSMGDDRLFRQDRAVPKASVTLRMMNNALVPAGTVVGVQQLVSAAVPQLDPSAVVVLDEGGQVLSARAAAPEDAGQLTPRMAEKRAIEQYFEARARTVLDRTYGQGEIAVTVWIDGPPAQDTASDKTPAAPALDVRNRSFRVQANLSSKAPLAEDAQKVARSLVGEAIGYNAALGDAIVFGPQQAMPVAAPAQPVVRLANTDDLHHASPEPEARSDSATLLLFGLVIGVLLLAIVALMVRRNKAALNDDAKLSFAERLKSLLDEGKIDGRTQS